MGSVDSNSGFSVNRLNTLSQELDNLSLRLSSESIDALDLQKSVAKVTALSRAILVDASREQASGDVLSQVPVIKESVQKLRSSLNEKDVARRILFPAEDAKSPSKQKGFIGDLSRSLTLLEEAFDEFEKFGHVIDKFESRSSFPETLAFYKEAFFRGLFGSIISSMADRIFGGHKSQVKLEKGRKEIAALDEAIKKSRAELEKVAERFDALDILPSSPKIEREIVASKEKARAKFEEHIELVNRRETLLEKYAKNEKGADKAKETRQNLCSIGGTSVKIKVEGDTLDGMYLSADSFRETLKEAGAQTFDLNLVSYLPGNEDISLRGLCFPPNTSDHIINKALGALGAFTFPDREGAGWQTALLSNGSTLVMTDEEVERLKYHYLIDYDGNLLESQDWVTTTKIKDWDIAQSLTGGTVILTSGNYGVYEMHKREILSYLMRGMNVMAFNFRGYGESSGNPTQRTVSRDLEAVYQYVKESHQIPDEKILFKALCMSGGAAAEVASNHPDVNLFIDQSYASFSDVIAKEVGDYLKKFADENRLGKGSFLALQAWLAINLMPLISSVIQYLSPAWSVEKNIGKVKGHVGILTTKEDDRMSIDRDLFRNYQAVMESKQAKSASVYAMEGRHADAWNNPTDRSYIIKAKPLEKADTEELATIEASSSAPMENFRLEIDTSAQLQNLVDDVVSTLPWDIQQSVGDYLYNECDGFLNKLWARSGNAPYFSKEELDDALGAFLKTIGDESHRRDVEWILGRMIRKFNAMQYYSYKTNPDLRVILDEIEDDYPDLNINKLNDSIHDFKARVESGANIQNEIAYQVGLEPDEWKALIEGVLNSVLIPKKPLISLYNEIQRECSRTDLVPSEIQRNIDSRIATLPKEYRQQFREFVKNRVTLPEELLDHKNYLGKRYEGRRQMDYYLNKAGLMGSLI